MTLIYSIQFPNSDNLLGGIVSHLTCSYWMKFLIPNKESYSLLLNLGDCPLIGLGFSCVICL